MPDSKMKTWARARMAPETWQRVADGFGRTGSVVGRASNGLRRWASIGSDTVTSMRTPRIEPWRLIFSVSVVLVPLTLISLLPYWIPPAVIMCLLLMLVALATYAADWIGGVTATAVGVVALDLLYLGVRGRFDAWHHAQDIWTVASCVATAAVLISIMEHMKYDRAGARLEATALRAANSAFNAVEIAAASRPAGDSEAYVSVLQSILTAMVRVNRASAGALYLVDGPNKSLIQAASYGETSDPTLSPGDDPKRIVPLDEGFVGQVARERRPIIVSDITSSFDMHDVLDTNPHVRSVIGVPIFGPTDALVGVAWIGLYVPYRYPQTTVARLQALAHRTVAFMESARVADAQVELLDRVQDNQRRLQAVIQTMPEAVMVARPPHGLIVASNAAAQRMFDIKPGTQLSSRRVDQLRIAAVNGDGDIDIPIETAMNEGVTVTGVELVVRTSRGEELPVVASAAPLINDAGEIDAAVGVFQDVSPLKEAERLRDEFISVVSHELRSPLTPIRGFAQVISRDLTREGGHEQHLKWLNTLLMHTDRLTRLVDDLLDVSRMRAGRLRVLHEDVDVVQILQAVVDSRAAAQTTHTLVFTTDTPNLTAMMDADRIHQVVDNLIGNAIKYTPGGTITITFTHNDDSMRFSVSDQGRGIPASDRESLFTAFYRSRDANESAVPGLGLGLYIVRELVLAHEGEIWVEEAQGGGASFVVELPRA